MTGMMITLENYYTLPIIVREQDTLLLQLVKGQMVIKVNETVVLQGPVTDIAYKLEIRGIDL